MVASFTALQLFSAYNFGKKFENSANSHLTVSYNILLYCDTKIDPLKLCIVISLRLINRNFIPSHRTGHQV